MLGRTYSTISKQDILSMYSETEILTSVFTGIGVLPCLICSPLRNDEKPSFYLYYSGTNHIRYKDFATGERGGLFDLLCQYWHCDFTECIKTLASMFISSNSVELRPFRGKSHIKTYNADTTVQVVTRPWRQYDYDYWESYGVEKQWLKYAEVYPISYKIITKRLTPDDKGHTYTFPADKYAYVFVERKEGKLQLKIYQPFNTKGFKWCSKMDGSVVGLWTKIPEKGDRVVICSSLKDALCLSSQCHIPTLCLQGEGYTMSSTAINNLKERYKRIYVSFDTDKAGIQDALKFSDETGFINVVPDLRDCKDFSDAYKEYGKEWFISHIKPLFP